jgi:hypothetical protein
VGQEHASGIGKFFNQPRQVGKSAHHYCNKRYVTRRTAQSIALFRNSVTGAFVQRAAGKDSRSDPEMRKLTLHMEAKSARF